MPWYDRYPERLQQELQALAHAGIGFAEDPDAKARGVLKLYLEYTWEAETFELEAIYPDFFPYAQPEVSTRGPSFRRHSNPNGNNICLIGRESIQWDVASTLAQVISERLPEILRFHRDGDQDQIRAVEIPQGEPVSEYFNGTGARNSFALFDSAWEVPATVRGGFLEAAGSFRHADGELPAPCFIVRRITDEKGRTVCEWSGPPLDKRWGNGADYKIPWVRLDPPPSGSLEEIGHAFMSGALGIKVPNISKTNKYARFAIVYQEEVQQFQFGLGLSLFEATYQPKAHKVEIRAIRTFRAGQSDLAARIPSVAALAGRRILLCGAGALGSNVAMELARNGVGSLDIVDFDYVEPATTRRWVAGLEEFGKDKVLAISDLIARNYPWTIVTSHRTRIGACRFDLGDADQFEELAELIGAAECIVDLTAEVSANQILADMAAWSSKPFVLANATPGAWGGMVFQARPDTDDACWLCMRSFLYPQSDELPVADPQGLIHPPGCGARTFSGTSFDLGEIAGEAVRVICGALGTEYPLTEWQLGICNLRSVDGRRIPPEWRGVEVPRREGCACQRS